MPEKRSPEGEQSVLALLTRLTGHLETRSARDERSIEALQEMLGRALPGADVTAVGNRLFSEEESDLFFADTVPAQRLKQLRSVSRKVAKEGAVAELRVFVRDVPVRSPQITRSVPAWAPGAAVEESMGPFRSKDGRQIWFDFFRIKKLIALYIDGRPDPVLLFETSTAKALSVKAGAAAGTGRKYKLAGDTVWVESRLLAANAPAGSYTGLRITGGEIALSAAPKTAGGKATMAPTTTATVKLALDQPKVTDADPSSPYGIDVRNATLDLPTELVFHFSGNGSAIDSIGGDANWNLYGQSIRFTWTKSAPVYDSVLNLILIPFTASEKTFAVRSCVSPFTTLSGAADIQRAVWALPTAPIDVTKPAPAAGIGALGVQCANGVAARWQGLQGGEVNLRAPSVFHSPGWINVTDFQAGNLYCNQEYRLWRDEITPHGSSVKLRYTELFPFTYNAFANGNEALLAFANTNPLLDRPVKVSGERLDIHSENSILLLAVNKAFRLIYIYDDNILFDNYDPNKPKANVPAPISIALHNALFKLTPVNGVLLFGQLAEDMVKVERASLFLTFGMYAYLPTLPDPYAANLDQLRYQFRKSRELTRVEPLTAQTIWLWLVCRTTWEPSAAGTDTVDVSFHFAPIQNQFQIAPEAAETDVAPSPPPTARAELGAHPFVRLFSRSVTAPGATAASSAAGAVAHVPSGDVQGMEGRSVLADAQGVWNERFSPYDRDVFALLDVSSNANQMGVSFAWFGGERMAMVRTHDVVAADVSAAADQFPVQVKGMDVVARGHFVRAFTVPQISWEPVLNLTSLDPGDPPTGPNYYPNDGGPTKLMNNSVQLVAIAPIPMTQFLVDTYASEANNVTQASFTLPFGLRSLAYLYKTNPQQAEKPLITFNAPSFPDDLKGGIQLQLTAGSGFNVDEDSMFRGYTLQIDNILDVNGQATGSSTLGHDVSLIFNSEFSLPQTSLDAQRGVPLTRMDVSGYGASIFSNWINRKAQFAATSQARFDVFVGRCAHEVIQVRSVLYPWGIKVVRTITLFRVGSGYVYRVDSGWKADSDGKFDFRFDYYNPGNPDTPAGTILPYTIHPGIVRGLFTVRNIRTAIPDVGPFLTSMDITAFYELDPLTHRPVKYNGGLSPVGVNLAPVYFDADIELENVVQGQVQGRVPAKKILGFVQLAPSGIPLTPDAFSALLAYQFGAIGGPLDCIIDIGKSGQKMRINRVDVNNSTDATGTQPVFAAAARGSVILPKDGSWSMVSHARATGEVTPLPQNTTVPLIRVGALKTDLTWPATDLLRIANPPELLRQPVSDTVNFGFLQSTNTQKAVFLTPAYEKQLSDTVPGKLLSKTPPLFADAYRLVNSKAIFPNIGDAVSNFGDAIALTKDFVPSALTDGGQTVLELMMINTADGVSKLKEDGYKLDNAVKSFPLPSNEWFLIEEDYLKVYVEYRAETKNPGPGTTIRPGALNFDVDSFAPEVADRWKSRLNNVAMVVDLGPFPRLMAIKGNFDAKKGAEAIYTGKGDADFPTPQIEFSKDLQPVIDILEVLAQLQGGDYAAAMKKGLKIAMSNSPDSWEYKFEASKEIPLLKFPFGPAYNEPLVPLKLEASMKLGVYFNAALTTAALGDPKKLLPTAGASMEFYGRLSVMCVSLAAATVYAVGQVNLIIAADTKTGPSLTMKFGFGAQIVVGLPVVGNVSLLYMVGVEIYADSQRLNVSAFLLFQGHAEILGGLIGVTITIEAKGTIEKNGDRTDCAAQVTFGLDISIFLVIDISFEESWKEQRRIA